MSVRRGSEWEEWIYGVGLCYLVEGPARRFEACCQLNPVPDVVAVADDFWSVASYEWLVNRSSIVMGDQTSRLFRRGALLM